MSIKGLGTVDNYAVKLSEVDTFFCKQLSHTLQKLKSLFFFSHEVMPVSCLPHTEARHLDILQRYH